MGSSTSIKILTFLPSILNNPHERRLKKQLKSVGTWTVIQNPLIGIFKCCLLLKNSLEDGHHIFLFCYLVDALWIGLVDMFYFSIFPVDILKFCYSVLLCVVWENNASIKKKMFLAFYILSFIQFMVFLFFKFATYCSYSFLHSTLMMKITMVMNTVFWGSFQKYALYIWIDLSRR